MASSKKARVEGLLTRGVEDVIERSHLKHSLSGRAKLRVKLGIDPTAPDLHLGHAVVLRKLKEFQDLGHKAVLIIGDFTGRIGDPSGRSKERKPLTPGDINRNMEQYLAQAGKIIDVKKAEIHHNSEWLGKDVQEVLELARAGTIQQVLKREDFRQRVTKGLTLLEALYPLLQGYDSVRVRADVELGGTDQLLNLLMGRQVQRHFGQTPQDVLTTSLLIGTDGVKKMSKSEGNYIALDDPPGEMFGKVMSIKDRYIIHYMVLSTNAPAGEVKRIARDLKLKKINPRDAKADLAHQIVSLYHGTDAAGRAAAEFGNIFRKKKLPARMSTTSLQGKSATVVEVVVKAGFARSKSGATRLVRQGGVSIDGTKILDPKARITPPAGGSAVLKVGKRNFAKIKRS